MQRRSHGDDRIHRWPVAAGTALVCALIAGGAGQLEAQGAIIDGTISARPASDSLFLGRWAIAYQGKHWRMDFGPNYRYRIWREEAGRDTLIASMGAWAIRPLSLGVTGVRADHLCLAPLNRGELCSRIILDDLGYPQGMRWQFVDAEEAALSLIGYRDGRAPWQLDVRGGGPAPVLGLSEVTERPRLLRCPVTPSFNPGTPVPERVVAELIVEPDSTASGIRVLDAPNATIRDEVERSLRSCRFRPGEVRGRRVRVRVRMPVPLGGGGGE